LLNFLPICSGFSFLLPRDISFNKTSHQSDRIQVVCLSLPDIEYGTDALKGLQSALNEFGGELLFARAYEEDASGFQSILSSLKRYDLDAILIPDDSKRAAQIAGQIRYQK